MNLFTRTDVLIYVPKDAYGRFCDYLANEGFTNIYTEKDYEYLINDCKPYKSAQPHSFCASSPELV